MTSDLDVYRTASVLIREHGDEADLVARARPGSKILGRMVLLNGRRGLGEVA